MNTKRGKNIPETRQERAASRSDASIHCIANVAALRRIALRAVKQCVFVLGYYTAGDGGGGNFSWDSASLEDDNGGTVIRPDSVDKTCAGRWKRHVDGPFSVRWFGAKGDGVGASKETGDTDAIRRTIEALPPVIIPDKAVIAVDLPLDPSDPRSPRVATGAEVYLPPGVYRVTNTLLLPKGITLLGASSYSAILFHDHEGACLQIGTADEVPVSERPDGAHKVRYVKVHRLSIRGRTTEDTPSGVAMQLGWATDNHIEDVHIRRTSGGVYLWNSWANRMTSVTVGEMRNSDCVRLKGDSNTTSITGCRFSAGLLSPPPLRGVWIAGTSSATITGTVFDSADIGIEVGDPEGEEIPQGVAISGCRFESQTVPLKVRKALGLSVTGSLVIATKYRAKNYADIKAMEFDFIRGGFISGNLITGQDPRKRGSSEMLEDPIGAAIRLSTEVSELAFVGNVVTGGFDRSIDGPVSDPNYHNSYVEIMSGGGHVGPTHPFRISGLQGSYLDLGAVEARDHVEDFDVPQGPARRRYGRLYVAKGASGELQLWAHLGEKAILIAS
jgi:hypothetical protein